MDGAVMCYFYDPDSLLNHPTAEGQELGQKLKERMEVLNGYLASGSNPKKYRPSPAVPESFSNQPPPGAFTVVCPAGCNSGDTIQVLFPGSSATREVTIPKGVSPG